MKTGHAHTDSPNYLTTVLSINVLDIQANTEGCPFAKPKRQIEALVWPIVKDMASCEQSSWSGGWKAMEILNHFESN